MKVLVVIALDILISLRGHQLGIDAGSVADAMGHTLRTHLESYDYAKTTTTKKAFIKARKLQAV